LIYLSLETPREGQAVHTHVHEIVSGLREIGWKVDLVATTRGGASSGSSYTMRLLDYVGAQWRTIRRLGQVDAVFMRCHFAALPAALAAKLRGVPVFQEVNGKPDDVMVTYRWLGWISPLIRRLYTWQMASAAHVFVVTEGLRGWAVEVSGHDRVCVVSNGVNTRLFTPEGPPSPIEGRYVAFVGGLTRWHGLSTMIAATRESTWPDGVRLAIVGDGVERAQLAGLERDARVLVLGHAPQPHAAAILRGALGALCVIEDPDGRSRTGVAPLKLFEAMASGVPVIVSDLPFQADLVRDREAGLVVPVADPAALATAVARLAADPDAARVMGVKGMDYARAEASWGARAADISRVMVALGHG
jgi:glycosyltransferase involved in cell wall biosynthesis